MKATDNRITISQRALAFVLLLAMLNSTVFPTAALALTSGPSQPEVQSFEPIGTSEMVDLFSGDFNYNLPLMDIDGYPLNMSYHSGITMDQEASWVGLGWNINPGVISRTMRGVPDDFRGDEIVKETNLKDNITVGIGAGLGAAFAGFEGLSLNVGAGINYNNYVGMGFEQSVNLTFNVSKSGKGPLSASLGFKSSNADGLTVSPSISLSAKGKTQDDSRMGASIGIGTSFNSRSGLKALSISGGVSYNKNVSSKTEAESIGVGGFSSQINFGAETFVPQVSQPMRNSSVMFSAQFGATVFSIDASANVNGYFSMSQLLQPKQTLPAYGYFYEHEGADLDNVMLDFNREKDGEFSVNTPGLPVTNHTYDVFSVSGQGVGGSYRLHRSDVGYVFDNAASSQSDSYSLGAEIAAGNTAEVGIDVTVTDVQTNSGKWRSDNPLSTNWKMSGTNTNKDYEPAYFKMAGEKVADPETNLSPYKTFSKNTPVRVGLNQDPGDQFTTATNGLKATYNAAVPQPATNKTAKRLPRSQEITYLKLSEKDYMLDPSGVSPNATKAGHFAEISVLQPDGRRYVYGRALYNTKQREVSFNASGNNKSCGSGYIDYNGSDNSLNNQKGADHFFSANNIPAYAHTYLLTALLSPDYVDVDGTRGPSKNDFGDFTAFEYQQNDAVNAPFSGTPSLNANTYKWRTPYAAGKANYNENMKTRNLDDQGNYVYGEKEQVYLKYIKTKNYVAVFELNDPSVDLRKDAWGAASENGGLPATNASSANQSRYLKSITLYSRPDFESRVTNPSYVPFPIKKVNFEYNYSLCPGIENSMNGAGKLTLTKVYFTYGTSNKAMFSPYEFTYGDVNQDGVTDANPSYHPKGYNKWGYYKPLAAAACNYNSPLSNSDYPYVEQNLTLTNNRIPEDYNVAAWSLTKIKLPSGGEIKVNYEADDYGYVQDRQAMQMFKLVDVIDAASFTSTYVAPADPLAPIDMGSVSAGKNKGIVLKLQKNNRYNTAASFSSLNAPTVADFKNLYLKELLGAENKLYFREYMKLNGAANNGYEYVSGYATIDPNSIQVSNTGYAFFKLKDETLNLGAKLSVQQQANPLSVAALKFARIHTSREAFNFAGEPSPNVTAQSIIMGMADAGFINTILQTFEGPEGYLYNTRGLGHHLIPGRSWVRLYNPFQDKLGGGSRVARITITDNWDTMDNQAQKSNYGQKFDYTTTTTLNGQTFKISSGVSTYEPFIGADENPFRLPDYSGNKAAPLAPDMRFYLEEPYGETLFPSPSVGYGKVTVTPLNLNANETENANVVRHATGYSVSEFYTAKDYPLDVNRTDMDVKQAKSSLLGQILKLDVKHYLTASQGFVVELNDMHGKPKANWAYAQGQDRPMSGVQYFYKDNYTTGANGVRNIGNKLSNDQVPIINKDGIYKDQDTYVGVEYDMVADFREEETTTITAGGQINLYVFYVAIPFMIPPVWPSFSKEGTRLRTASFTKVINRYGILEETVAYEEGAKISTKNLLWDGETGEVLLTRTQNEFEDYLYSMNIPAHWAYEGMGPAYSQNRVSGTYSTLTSLGLLKAGDELIVSGMGAAANKRCYMTGFGLIDINNATVTPGANTLITVIRPNKRNMQNVSVGSFTALRTNPLASVTQGTDFFAAMSTAGVTNTYSIIAATAIEFTDEARLDCDCYPTEKPNNYYWGLKGNWHPLRSYTYLAERSQTATGADPNAWANPRTDGTFTFTPFWKTGNITPGFHNKLGPNATNWTWTNSLSLYSVEGQELESRDALNRYSAATFGYNNKLPLSVSGNSLYREVGFDGFEDYYFNACPNPRFKFKAGTTVATPDGTRSHTGRYSIKVQPNNSVYLQKLLEGCSQGSN